MSDIEPAVVWDPLELEHELHKFLLSDMKPAFVSDPTRKWFRAGIFYGLKEARWSINGQVLYLNPKFPDSIDFINQCKVPTRSTSLDNGLKFLKVFRSYQH